MKDIKPYKGYVAEAKLDEESGKIFGTVVGIADDISFEAESEEAVESSFHRAVDEYIERCESEGKPPARFYQASFVSGFNNHFQ